MPESCLCRLTMVAEEAKLPSDTIFHQWIIEAGGLYLELLTYDSERITYQFETTEAPLQWMASISSEHPKLTFLLDYEIEESRCKGLAKAVQGKIEHHQVRY